jgi:hypothetical protein
MRHLIDLIHRWIPFKPSLKGRKLQPMQAVQPSIAAPAEIQQIAGTYKMGSIEYDFGPNTSLASARRRGGYMMMVMTLIFCLIGLASMSGGAAG